MRTRSGTNRRTDSWLAERIELATLTARAFDLRAARNYLRLSGVDDELAHDFISRYPFKLRATGTLGNERRHS